MARNFTVYILQDRKFIFIAIGILFNNIMHSTYILNIRLWNFGNITDYLIQIIL